MKSVVLCLILLCIMGCTQKWQAVPWYTISEDSKPQTAVTVSTETARFKVQVTEFRQIKGEEQGFLGIVVACRNLKDTWLLLDASPFHVSDSSDQEMEPLRYEYVSAKLNAGRKPPPSSDTPYGSDPVGSVAASGSFLESLARLVTSFDGSSLTSPDELPHRAFQRGHLAEGAKAEWINYYPFTDPIHVELRRKDVVSQIAFTQPQTPVDTVPRYPLFAIVSGVAVSLVVILSS